jgi:hypothetical protein
MNQNRRPFPYSQNRIATRFKPVVRRTAGIPAMKVYDAGAGFEARDSVARDLARQPGHVPVPVTRGVLVHPGFDDQWIHGSGL